MTKLKWKVDELPTGMYRSFQRRGWPSATTMGGRPAAMLVCADEYVPRNVRTGNHAEIKVLVADWKPKGEQERAEHGTFVWRTLKQRAKTLDEAKRLAEKFLGEHPEFLGEAPKG